MTNDQIYKFEKCVIKLFFQIVSVIGISILKFIWDLVLGFCDFISLL